VTLEEIARAMAERLGLTLERVADGKAHLSGRSATVTVSPFFGGWQVDLVLPGYRPSQFFEEDIRMLVERVEQRLRYFAEHGPPDQPGGGTCH